MAGVCVALLVDAMRKGVDDIVVDAGEYLSIVGGVYTPIRQFMAVTWIVLILTFILACGILEDFSVVDANDPDEEYLCQTSNDAAETEIPYQKSLCTNDSSGGSHLKSPLPLDGEPAEPMIWFAGGSYRELQEQGDEREERNDKLAPPQYTIHRTKYAERDRTSPCQSILHIAKQFVFIIQMRETWRVLTFSFLSVPVILQWTGMSGRRMANESHCTSHTCFFCVATITANDIVLPPFLERRFGELIPIYTVQSIHQIGCAILPPLAQALTSSWEDFDVVVPGVRSLRFLMLYLSLIELIAYLHTHLPHQLWIMAVSPLLIALFPTVRGACLWQSE